MTLIAKCCPESGPDVSRDRQFHNKEIQRSGTILRTKDLVFALRSVIDATVHLDLSGPIYGEHALGLTCAYRLSRAGLDPPVFYFGAGLVGGGAGLTGGVPGRGTTFFGGLGTAFVAGRGTARASLAPRAAARNGAASVQRRRHGDLAIAGPASCDGAVKGGRPHLPRRRVPAFA